MKKQQRPTNRIPNPTSGTHEPVTLATSMLSCAKGGGDPAPPDPNPEAPPILDGKDN